MASSQGTSVSSNSFSRWASHDIYLFKYHFLLHILRCLFFFSDNIMADVATKQQKTALLLSTIVTRTRHTELTKKLTNLMGNLSCAREHSVQFFLQFSYTVKMHSLTYSVWGPWRELSTDSSGTYQRTSHGTIQHNQYTVSSSKWDEIRQLHCWLQSQHDLPACEPSTPTSTWNCEEALKVEILCQETTFFIWVTLRYSGTLAGIISACSIY